MHDSFIAVLSMSLPMWQREAAVVTRLIIRNARRELLFELLVKLQLIEPPVKPAFGKQVLVFSHFPNFTFVHNDDLVDRLNSREAVSYDQ